MADELLERSKWEPLVVALAERFLSIGNLRAWLVLHYPNAVPNLRGEAIKIALTNLLEWSNGVDGMRQILQQLADHPVNDDSAVPLIVSMLTLNEIKPNKNGPPVPRHLYWFAAGRPFVNRRDLRNHLASLDASPAGAECILVIDGDGRTGKTFAVSLVNDCRDASRRRSIDVNDYARRAKPIDVLELAKLIVPKGQGWPDYDVTKESEAVPSLVDWLVQQFSSDPEIRWIIVDHCRGRTLTDAARSLLKDFAGKLRNGTLPNVRLILVDFDRDDLPAEWRDYVRFDRAELPALAHVKEWCEQIAQVERRKRTPDLLDQWAGAVFDQQLQNLSRDDGSWHQEFERRLRKAVDSVMAAEAEA